MMERSAWIWVQATAANPVAAAAVATYAGHAVWDADRDARASITAGKEMAKISVMMTEASRLQPCSSSAGAPPA